MNTDLLRTKATETKDPKVLDGLADHVDYGVRYYVAHNEMTSTKTLDRMSYDENDTIRLAVASNRNTSLCALLKLKTDRHLLTAITAIRAFKDRDILDELLS